MTRRAKHAIAILVASALVSCGREPTPTGPSGPTSFLTGTGRFVVNPKAGKRSEKRRWPKAASPFALQ